MTILVNFSKVKLFYDTLSMGLSYEKNDIIINTHITLIGVTIIII